ncbi:UvrD-helicase domain-containing protein, partial [Candidatus Saccharibacteria bacterium]|nr:UvrD-helicase domain-containing protein [Candidatus Saccharibacteria bacterium]
MDFSGRYKKLNENQRRAVDTIDGPVMVIAGPGTGKTELLAMRAANILKQTDALPENILCLTFTEAGSVAMKKRLTSIIGRDAYNVSVFTFHAFGTDIMGRYREYFYNGADFSAADDLARHRIITDILDSLPYDN